MKRDQIPIHLTISDIAGLCDSNPETIDRLIRSGIHPPWRWTRQMSRPRFGWDTIPAWLRILSDVDLSSLPSDPPPLQRPADVFEQTGPTADELQTAARILGIPWKKAVCL